MLTDAIERTGMAEGRLTRSELFHELAKMHRRSLPRPGPAAQDREAFQRNGASRVQLLKAAAAAPPAKRVALEV